jgi:hypothetical protein
VLCGLAVFITQAVVNGALFALVGDRLPHDAALFRPEGQELWGVYMASRVLFVSMFVLLFARWFRGRGPLAGIRYGLAVWLLYSIPMTVGFWSFLKLPGVVAFSWVAFGFAELVASGVVLGWLFARGTGRAPGPSVAAV